MDELLRLLRPKQATQQYQQGAVGTDVPLMADDLEKLAYALKLAKQNQHVVNQYMALSAVVIGALVIGAVLFFGIAYDCAGL